MINWIDLQEDLQLEKILADSTHTPQVIYKHSTRCSVSSMIKGRLDRQEVPDHISFYYLDLIAHRNLSNKVAHDFGVRHESPQVLVIVGGKCVYNESHSSIYMEDIAAAAG